MSSTSLITTLSVSFEVLDDFWGSVLGQSCIAEYRTETGRAALRFPEVHVDLYYDWEDGLLEEYEVTGKATIHDANFNTMRLLYEKFQDVRLAYALTLLAEETWLAFKVELSSDGLELRIVVPDALEALDFFNRISNVIGAEEVARF